VKYTKIASRSSCWVKLDKSNLEEKLDRGRAGWVGMGRVVWQLAVLPRNQVLSCGKGTKTACRDSVL
jgi:hypothetical protein